MNWYYVDAGQQAGPVDDAQLEALVQSGKIQPETLVWREGMPNWSAYRQVAPATTNLPPVAAPLSGSASGVICSQCGRAFPPSEVIHFGDKWVCAACKPLFFQRLGEGAALGATVGGATEADHILGDMVRRAQAKNVAAPLLQLAYSHLQAYDLRRKAAKG